jgi:hypothetical protein
MMMMMCEGEVAEINEMKPNQLLTLRTAPSNRDIENTETSKNGTSNASWCGGGGTHRSKQTTMEMIVGKQTILQVR